MTKDLVSLEFTRKLQLHSCSSLSGQYIQPIVARVN